MQKGLLKKCIYSIWAKRWKEEVWKWYSFCSLGVAKTRVSRMRETTYLGPIGYEKISVWRLHSKAVSSELTTYDLMRIGEELKV